MSSRYYDKGSSRSARDDSRTHKERSEPRERQTESKERERRGTRSRSPRRNHSPSSSRSKYPTERSRSREREYGVNSRKKSWHSNSGSDEEVPAPPPPPRISKISIGFTKPKAPIKMNIGGAKAMTAPKPTIASVFNSDEDDEEPEEMPAEARMRMRNIGRETPTSAGPNSFGKTKQGFCDAKKVFEKNLKEALETQESKSVHKFPQTIYKIKP